MTQEERKVFEMALEALESSRIFVTSREKIKHPEGTDWYDERILAIKEALAQTEQEPVAWISTGPARMIHWTADKPDYGDDWVPLYTTPPQRKPMTDEQIAEVAERMEATDAASSFWREFARAIEAAHNIKE